VDGVSRWFRHYAGMMRDDKLVRVAIRSKQPIERVAWIWGAILESAAEIDNDGRYDVDAAEVAYFLRADQADVDAILDSFAAAGRLAKGRVVKWGNRQFQSDRSKERVAAHRERKRQARDKCNGISETGNDAVTLQEQPSNAPETELETDTEVSEAIASSPRKAWACPIGVDPDHWRDFMANRKTRRLTNSPTAYKGQLKAIAEISDDEWPPGRLVEYAAAKGWGSINDPRANGQANGQHSLQRPRTNPTLDLLRAANAEIARSEAGEDHLRIGPPLQAAGYR
jgi:hypothetical protein